MKIIVEVKDGIVTGIYSDGPVEASVRDFDNIDAGYVDELAEFVVDGEPEDHDNVYERAGYPFACL